MTQNKEPKTPVAPWMSFAYDENNEGKELPGVLKKADISAIKAVSNGVANEDQQKRCIAAIYKLSRVGDLPYRPDGKGGDRDTAFACGMLFVGQQLNKIVKHSAAYLAEKQE